MATDLYSLGLLLWRVHLDGKNPFEELGIIPSEWPEREKIHAIRFLKESDCVSPLYFDSLDIEARTPFSIKWAGLLRKDPFERPRALEEFAGILYKNSVISEAIKDLQTGKPKTLVFRESPSKDKITGLETGQEPLDDTDELPVDENEQDPLDLFPYIALINGQSFVPDCVSTLKPSAFHSYTQILSLKPDLTFVLLHSNTYPGAAE